MPESQVLTDRNLRERLGNQMWRQGVSEKPNFSMEQLVLIAMYYRYSRPMSIEDILDTILELWPYYRKLVKSEVVNSSQRWNPSIPSIMEYEKPTQAPAMLQQINQIIHQVEPGFTRQITDHDLMRVYLPQTNYSALLYEAADGNGSSKEKRADFFKLPADLRLIIYSMVFAYPRDGLFVDSYEFIHHEIQRFKVVENEYTPGTAIDRTRATHQIITRPLAAILAPLLTCRRFYTEAMPTFYRVNHFYMQNMKTLWHFFSGIAANRLKHFTNVSVVYNTHEGAFGPKGVRLLTDIEHLQKLHIHIDERDWLNRSLSYRRTWSGTDEEKRRVLCVRSVGSRKYRQRENVRCLKK